MIRINAKSIGIKTPVKVTETIKKVKETFKFQSNVLKQGKAKGSDPIDKAVNYYDGQVKSIEMMIHYIEDMLDLSAAQIKNLKKAEFPKVADLSNTIVVKMLHYDTNDKEQSKGKK